jgi:transposase
MQTLETTPRRWKVIETVREKLSCRDCETISQAPAPFHVIPRGWAGPSLLAMIVVKKFGQRQPLNRQAERYALEGAPIALSTVADAVGAVCLVGVGLQDAGITRQMRLRMFAAAIARAVEDRRRRPRAGERPVVGAADRARRFVMRGRGAAIAASCPLSRR